MGLTIQTHPDRFELTDFTNHPNHPKDPFVTVEAYEDGAKVSLFLKTPEQCDELMRLAAEAKRLLAPPVPPECLLFVPAQISRLRLRCTLAAGHDGLHEAHGTDPLITWTDEEWSSVAEVAEGVEPAHHCRTGEGMCSANSELENPDDPGSFWCCTAQAGHGGDHVAYRVGGTSYATWPQAAAAPSGTGSEPGQ